MITRFVKSLLPRSLMGRAILILVVPVSGLLLLVAAGVIQRHYDRVTRQLTGEFVRIVTHLDQVAQRGGAEAVPAAAEVFGVTARLAPPVPAPEMTRLPPWELAARLVRRELGQAFPQALALNVGTDGVQLQLPLSAPPAQAHDAGSGPLALHLSFSTSRLTASNPHQLLVIAILAAVLMTLIAWQFLRIQLRPIRRLALAAEAFGRGEAVPLRVSGAAEVRAAGHAFLDMRDRIEAQIEQRMLMLSGVSHDLRTPLTRARLALSLMEDEPEAAAVLVDLAQMEALIARYLDFVRDGAAEPEAETDLPALVAAQVEAAARDGWPVSLRPADRRIAGLRLRPGLLARALDNLLGNAARYASRAEVWIDADAMGGVAICVEDDGPGIPPERRAEALRPFARLDGARAADGGVGLGLAIAADAMRSHGGRIELDRGQSPGLGGLLVRLVLPAQASARPEGRAGQSSRSIQTGV